MQPLGGQSEHGEVPKREPAPQGESGMPGATTPRRRRGRPHTPGLGGGALIAVTKGPESLVPWRPTVAPMVTPALDRSRGLLRVLVRTGLRRPVLVVSLVIAALATMAGTLLFIQVGDQTAREADERLARHVAEQSDRIGNLYVQAQRDIRLARRNSALDEVMAKPLPQVTAADRERINAALTYVGERYAVDEMCLILANGTELGRWDHGQTYAPELLSTEELVNNPGVIPTLARPDDTVYVVPEPYISPDTERWVTAFLTPVVIDSGRSAGVLHFEIPIQSFAEELAADPFGESDYSFILDRTGRLLVHPDIAEFRRASGLPVDPADSPFPAATALGSDSWRAAIQAAQASPGGFASFEAAGETYRLRFQAVEGPEWIIGTVVPGHQLYAAVDRAHLNLVVTIGPLILLMVVISAWFAGRLSRTNRWLAAANAALGEATRATSQLAAIVRSADDAIFSIEPDGTISTWNSAAAAMYHVSASEAIGTPMARLFPVERLSDLPTLMSAVLSGHPVERYETVLQRADGTTFDAWLTFSPIGDADDVVTGVSVVARDVSDRKRLEEELAHQALHDALTGLPNRVLFQDRLQESLHQGVGPKRPITGRHAVLFIDLDDFKVINDTLGHRIGDELLVAMARRLEDCLRAGDTAARLGGDEFTVLLHNVVGVEEAERAAERILLELQQPFELEGHQVVVSASIGIALGAPGVDEPDDLLRAADTALYEAKGHGKGRHETYQDTMNVRAWRRLELEAELRNAIKGGQLRVHYQPIVDMASGAIVEVEALVRWEHPTRGLLAPGEFLPIAEQTGLIIPIGEFVRETALRDLARCGATHPTNGLSMSVNVSPRELGRPGFAAGISALLARTSIPAGRLIIEITESAMLEGESALQALRALREIGVRVWIDDFGTGYSSLGYFTDLPLDGLKIDRLFVDGLGTRPEHTAIITAALAFAEALGLDVVGEGIETDDQRSRLGDLGCHLGQGFLFSKPMDFEHLDVLLTGQPQDRNKDISAA
jgi:diguanylate cyclase (GGDEF)-like protein/PAS domain S-box-containing protein